MTMVYEMWAKGRYADQYLGKETAQSFSEACREFIWQYESPDGVFDSQTGRYHGCQLFSPRTATVKP